MTHARTLAIILLCLCLSVAALVGAREWQLTNRQIRSAINEGQWLIAEARPETRTILSQIKLGTFETRATIKALGEEINSPEQRRARLATIRSGEQVTIAAAHLTTETLPRLDAAIDTSRMLIARTDTALNDQFLPEATRTLAALRATAETLNTDGHAILQQILVLAQQGEVSLGQINQTLASDEWLKILANIERSTSHIAGATAELPATAASIERILRTAGAYQKPLLIAQILATLARALF